MKHPTSVQVAEVVRRFDWVLEEFSKRGDCTIDMQCGIVEDDPGCGTIACHAGWYAVAKLHVLGSGFYWEDAEDREQIKILMAGVDVVNYGFGAGSLAYDLGFKDEYDLQEWAASNPSIWGNCHGYHMFINPWAFKSGDVDDERPFDLRYVRDHWDAVRRRLDVIENEESIV